VNQMQRIKQRALLLLIAVVALTMSARLMRADTGSCGNGTLSLPFNDVPGANAFFCAIAEAYFTGLTNGTTATTYSPANTVTREQMAAFITRTFDQGLKRGNRRAALQQWWTPTLSGALRPVELGGNTGKMVCDGADLWVDVGNQVRRVEASNGRITQTWTLDVFGSPIDVIAAAGRIYVLVNTSSSPGLIYFINPEATVGGAMTAFEDDIGISPIRITFDGTNLWTANDGGGPQALGGGISRVRISDAQDSTFSTGFNRPRAILWDGAALWVLDYGDNALKEVNPATGGVISTLGLAALPREMIFDGMNLWITHTGGSLTIVRAVGGLRGTVLQTITGNGLNGCFGLAFDGERVLVANEDGDSVSLFKAADFTPLGSLSTGAGTDPSAVCSDGLNFWIARPGSDDIVRF
jgi:DNA-binding beta-propeller fold protein YncE